MKITANTVTVARMILLPLPCIALLYGSIEWMWISFGVLILIGASDFVDGMMARREGPTRLGSLLDPAADKIFIAASSLTLGAIGVIPWWAPVAILSREFLMTVLRTSVALHKSSVKTTLLGKMKTIIQMGGFGTIFMTVYLPKFWIYVVALFLFGSLMGVWFYLLSTRKRWPPFWILPVASSFLYWFLLCVFFQVETAVLWQLLVIVGITWFSAFDYMATTYKVFRIHGLTSADGARIFWALTHSIGVVAVASFYPTTVLALIFALSFELGVGAIDNVVASDASYAGRRPFVIASIAAWLMMVMILVSPDAMLLSVGLACLSGISLVATFYRWRHLFSPIFQG